MALTYRPASGRRETTLRKRRHHHVRTFVVRALSLRDVLHVVHQVLSEQNLLSPQLGDLPRQRRDCRVRRPGGRIGLSCDDLRPAIHLGAQRRQQPGLNGGDLGWTDRRGLGRDRDGRRVGHEEEPGRSPADSADYEQDRRSGGHRPRRHLRATTSPRGRSPPAARWARDRGYATREGPGAPDAVLLFPGGTRDTH